MQTISPTYRVTTPMFLGGAEQQAELRLPSFKGVLRSWWRALAWDRVKDAPRLRDEEEGLFGSSDEQVGQSKVLMRLDRAATVPTTLSPPAQLKDGTQVVGSGARYLGYGVMGAFVSKPRNTKEGQLTRPCLIGCNYCVVLIQPSGISRKAGRLPSPHGRSRTPPTRR